MGTSASEIRVIIAAEVDRAIAEMKELGGAVRSTTKEMGASMNEAGAASEGVSHKFEHLAVAGAFAFSSLANDSTKGVDKVIHAIALLGFAWGPLVGTVTTSVALVIEQFMHMNEKAEEERKKFEDTLHGFESSFSLAAKRMRLAILAMERDAILEEIKNMKLDLGHVIEQMNTIKELSGKAEELNRRIAALSASLVKDNAADANSRATKNWENSVRSLDDEFKQLDADIKKAFDRAKEGTDQGKKDAAELEEQWRQTQLAIAERLKDPAEAMAAALGITVGEAQELLGLVKDDTDDVTRELEQSWLNAFNSLPEAANRAYADVQRSGQGMGAFWKFMLQEMAAASVAWGVRDVANHAATWLAKKNITLTGVLESIAIESAGAIKRVAIAVWEAAQWIATKALEGGAAAWKEWADTGPWGFLIGAGVAAATIAGIMALANNLPSARGGFDVPAGVNPVTQLHEREMVLPAEYADVIRGMAGGGGASEMHFHIHTLDTVTMGAWLRQSGVPSMIAQAAQKGAGRGALDSGVGRRSSRI